MKKNEIIELNGVEYTVELNRESFIKIDQLCNLSKSMDIINRGFYKFMDEEELTDDFDINSLEISEDDIEKEMELKEKTLQRNIERAFYIWLYPNHHLKPSEVKEILKPYFEGNDEEKNGYLGDKYGEYLQKCLEIRESYVSEQKNLKALANKK